jgi:DNA replication protein DnaC
MTAEHDLVPVLKKLRMSGILQSLELRVRQSVDDDVHPTEFIYRVLHDELERREAKQLSQRMRRARFESDKAIEDFDFKFNPDIPKARLLDLATCAFVERKENVCLVGPAGVGKSHIAQALGQRAVRAGYAAVYTRCTHLLSQLQAARADGSYDRALGRFTSPDLLIIDDVGLRPLRSTEPEDLFEVLRGRYEQGATIVTSNRALEEWFPLFGDDLLASATMDRLLHHAHVIVMQGDSYRNPPSGKR